MAATNLTQNKIDKLVKPAKAAIEISDTTPGLFLYVTKTGAKSWFAVYRVKGAGDGGRAGKRTKMKIGVWPVMTVEAARAEATRIMALAASSIDPREQAEAAEQERLAEDQSTVQAVSDTWLSAMQAGQITGARKRPASYNTYRNRETVVRLHIAPRIGAKRMDQVTPAVLGRMLNDIDREGGPVDGTLKVVKALWSFAKSRGLAHGEAPSADLKARQPKKYDARSLGDDEIRHIWGACEQIGYPFGYAIQMLMLTGQRKNEIAEAKWDWLDPERGTLTIPASSVKNRKGAHEVVLSHQSIGILERVAQLHEVICPKSEFIFTSATGRTPISGWATTMNRLAKLRSEAGDTPRHWRLHDLRHTLITRSRYGEQNADGEVTWSPALDVIQATVNHSLSEGVTGIYDHSDMALRYRIRRRELAQWYSDKVMGIVDDKGAN